MSIPNPIVPGLDGQPVRLDRPMTDEEVVAAGGQLTEPADPEVADDLEAEASSEQGFTYALPARLAEIITLLEGVDLEAAVTTIEDEPLPVEGARQAAMNRADRAELVRAFVALQQAGRGIVRRLENDAQGLVRDE